MIFNIRSFMIFIPRLWSNTLPMTSPLGGSFHLLSYSSNNNSYNNISSYNNSNNSSRNSSNCNSNSSCNLSRCTCRFHQWTITRPSCQQSTRHTITITTNTNS